MARTASHGNKLLRRTRQQEGRDKEEIMHGSEGEHGSGDHDLRGGGAIFKVNWS